MIKSTPFRVAAIAAGALCSATMAVQASDEFAAAQVEEGKKLFTRFGCYACHGYAGQGGVHGPRIAPYHLPMEIFAEALRRPRNDMPPYTDVVVSRDQVAALYAFILSISKQHAEGEEGP